MTLQTRRSEKVSLTGVAQQGHDVSPADFGGNFAGNVHVCSRGRADEETLFATGQVIEDAAGRIKLPQAWWA